MSGPSSSPTASDAATSTRRWLLRGGAVAAGAAVVAAAAPGAALAADGDPVELGAENSSTNPTTISIGDASGSTDPTLALENADGPTLYLQPLNYEDAPQVQLGQITNTQLGPVIGVESLLGQTTTFLATGIDLADLPTPYALPKPVRLLDTRTSAGRAGVLRTSVNAYDSSFRLQAGAWLDVEVTVEDADLEVPSAFLNVLAVGAQAGGFICVYPPVDRPGTSTLNFAKGSTIANGSFVATTIVQGRYAVRIYTSAATHVVLDLTGVTLRGSNPPAEAAEGARKRAAAPRLRSELMRKLSRRLAR